MRPGLRRVGGGGAAVRTPYPEKAMNALLLVSSAIGGPGSELPPQATAVDNLFAFGALALLTVMVVWSGFKEQDPPES